MVTWQSRAKTAVKYGRLTVEVAWQAASPAVGPVVNQYVGPPTTYASVQRQVHDNRVKDWAEGEKARLVDAGSRLGHPPPPASVPGRDPKLARPPRTAADRSLRQEGSPPQPRRRDAGVQDRVRPERRTAPREAGPSGRGRDVTPSRER